MTITTVDKNKYPTIYELIQQIFQHRKKCFLWNKAEGNKCPDCHYGMVSKIEEELK